MLYREIYYIGKKYTAWDGGILQRRNTLHKEVYCAERYPVWGRGILYREKICCGKEKHYTKKYATGRGMVQTKIS